MGWVMDPMTATWYNDETGETSINPPVEAPPPTGPAPTRPAEQGNTLGVYSFAWDPGAQYRVNTLGGTSSTPPRPPAPGQVPTVTSASAGTLIFQKLVNGQWVTQSWISEAAAKEAATNHGLDWSKIQALSAGERAQIIIALNANNTPNNWVPDPKSGVGTDQIATRMKALQDMINGYKSNYGKVDPNAPTTPTWTRPGEDPQDAAGWGIDINKINADPIQKRLWESGWNNFINAKTQAEYDMGLSWLASMKGLYGITPAGSTPAPGTTPGTPGTGGAWGTVPSGVPTDAAGWQIDPNDSRLGFAERSFITRYLGWLANPTGRSQAEIDQAIGFLDQIRRFQSVPETSNDPTTPPGTDPNAPPPRTDTGWAPDTFAGWQIDESLIPESQRATWNNYLATLHDPNATNDQIRAALDAMSYGQTLYGARSTSTAPPQQSFDPNAWMETINQMFAGFAEQMANQNANPLSAPPPDPMDSDILSAMRAARQQAQMRSGYQSTFVTGPRGEGGPSKADWISQLTSTPMELGQQPDELAQQSSQDTTRPSTGANPLEAAAAPLPLSDTPEINDSNAPFEIVPGGREAAGDTPIFVPTGEVLSDTPISIPKGETLIPDPLAGFEELIPGGTFANTSKKYW